MEGFDQLVALLNAQQTILVEALKIIHRLSPGDLEALRAELAEVQAHELGKRASDRSQLSIQLQIELLDEALGPPPEES